MPLPYHRSVGTLKQRLCESKDLFSDGYKSRMVINKGRPISGSSFAGTALQSMPYLRSYSMLHMDEVKDLGLVDLQR